MATAENEVQEDIFEDVMEAEIMEQPDRPRLLAAGFPNRSFVDPNTPSRSRPIGYLGQKWVNFLYGNRRAYHQYAWGYNFPIRTTPKKISVTELGIIFQGSPLFLALLFVCFVFVSVHKYKYP